MNAVKTHNAIYKMVLIAILAAIIIMLQCFMTFKIGPINLAVTLVPVVLGGALLGVWEGTLLGFIFGLSTFLCGVFALDPFTNYLISLNAFTTGTICILKGTLAGFVPAIIIHLLEKRHQEVGIVLGSAAAPIVNTGIFCITFPIFFMDYLKTLADGKNVFVFIITGLVGFNFIFEFLVNVILSTAIAFVVKVIKK